MSLDDRIGYVVLGCIIGFILGYFTHWVRNVNIKLDEIKEELDEVDEIVKKEHDGPAETPDRPQSSGYVKGEYANVNPKRRWLLKNWKNVLVFIVVFFTGYSAILSQLATNHSNEAVENTDRTSQCLVESQTAALVALNERTEFSSASANANRDLQSAQGEFFAILLHKPPYSEQKRNEAAQKYFEALTNFNEIAAKQAEKVAQNPYPTAEDLANCVKSNT